MCAQSHHKQLTSLKVQIATNRSKLQDLISNEHSIHFIFWITNAFAVSMLAGTSMVDRVSSVKVFLLLVEHGEMGNILVLLWTFTTKIGMYVHFHLSCYLEVNNEIPILVVWTIQPLGTRFDVLCIITRQNVTKNVWLFFLHNFEGQCCGNALSHYAVCWSGVWWTSELFVICPLYLDAFLPGREKESRLVMKPGT